MISVVICTFNRASSLACTMRTFLDQECLARTEHELIIIDNNSTDNTRAVVEELMGRGRNIRYYFEGIQGLSHARNRGIFESKGQLVAFIDDDVLLSRNWLVSLNRVFDETNADVIGGSIRLLLSGKAEPWLGQEFRQRLSETSLGPNRKCLLRHEGPNLFGANIHFKKEIFKTIGLFDVTLGRRGSELLVAEETELVDRAFLMQGTVVYDPDIVVDHVILPSRMEWKYFERLAMGVGRSKEYREPNRGRGFQMLRVCKSLANMVRSKWTLSYVRRRDYSPYEQKRAEWRVLENRSYLIARWKRLSELSRTRE